MFRSNGTRSRQVTSVLRFILPVLVLVSLWGCGEQDPDDALRKIGAKIEQNQTDQVTSVSLPGSATDAALVHAGALPFLTDLDLSGTQISDAGLVHLSGLENLEVLDLSNTAVTNAGLAHIKKLKSLKTLRIGDTDVTSKGLDHLAGLENLKNLSLRGKDEPAEPKERTLLSSIRLGIDLAGGTNLVFQVEGTEDKPVTSDVMKQMVAAVGRRINPSGTEEVTARQVGSDRIEVIIPGADREDVERIKKIITTLGSLEFAILANQQDHKGLIAKARNLRDDQKDIIEGGRVRASWRPVGRDRQGVFKDVSEHGEVATREVERDGETVKEFFVVFEQKKYRVTGEYLTKAYETTDETGSPAVGFLFNTTGGFLFQKLTSANRPRKTDDFMRRLAVLLNEEIHSAPNLRETISTSGQISGRFSREEIDELTSVLNAGALEVPIQKEPISEFSISPLLGHDVQEKGKWAIIWAAAVVLVFMLVYYLFAGMVANMCLVLNLILVLGAMALIDATFTLPGLAGLVLTIGMAVDANVLIFERIREEANRGSSLRMAIQNGFARAFTTIVDANVTTLITAVVLYMIGTDQVRGFAVTLFIGIVMSMFTALYIGRLVFDVFERKRWLTSVKMLSIVGATRLDFIGKKAIAAVCSVALIIVGMGTVLVRGEDNLDIDFSGGAMVTFELVEEPGKPVPTIDEIRNVLQNQPDLGSSITLERLTTLDELEKGIEAGNRYRLRSKEQDVNRVESAVNEALTGAGYHLLFVTMEFGPIVEIPKAGSGVDPAKKDDDNSGAEKKAEDGEKDQASPAPDDEYAGGHQVELAFSNEVKETTIAMYLADKLDDLKLADGGAKYEKPESLFAVAGAEGSGIKAREGETRQYDKMLLKARPDLEKSDLSAALKNMQHMMATSPIFEEVNSFASSVATEMQQSAVMAMLASLVAIVAYIWFRFQRITFGLAAVAALVHDVLVVLGMVALASYLSGTGIGKMLLLYDFKINLPMVAAFMTIVGYSLNDTIVVFDRIREVRGKNPALTEDMVNRSLNQTLARTLLTSLTTLIVVGILYAIGGEGIHGFAFCLVMGVLVGTYSSIFVASPVLLWLMNRPSGQPGQTKAAA